MKPAGQGKQAIINILTCEIVRHVKLFLTPRFVPPSDCALYWEKLIENKSPPNKKLIFMGILEKERIKSNGAPTRPAAV